jgi:hypothetical protein
MQEIRKAMGFLLGLTGTWMIINGTMIAMQTMGRVTGTEFSMLIAVNNQLGLVLVWLGLFGLWSVMPEANSDE